MGSEGFFSFPHTICVLRQFLNGPYGYFFCRHVQKPHHTCDYLVYTSDAANAGLHPRASLCASGAGLKRIRFSISAEICGPTPRSHHCRRREHQRNRGAAPDFRKTAPRIPARPVDAFVRLYCFFSSKPASFRKRIAALLISVTVFSAQRDRCHLV